MSNDLLNILSNSNKDIDNQQLMDYLSGKLSGEEKFAVEKMMADNDFMNDAIEGLETVGNKKDIQVYVEELNANLQKSLSKKKQRRMKRKLREGPWGYVAILLILLLCIAGYLIVKKVMMARGG